MKNKSKTLLIVLCAVLLVTASVLGTLAYLTSTDDVVNTFTVGKVQIVLDEAKVNPDGTLVTGTGAGRGDANDYHLLPGHEYDKDPTVTVLEGSEECYVRMLVTIDHQTQIDSIVALNNMMSSVFTGYDSTAWPLFGTTHDTAANTRTYEFRYYKTVAAPANAATPGADDVALKSLFTGITAPNTLTNADLEKLDDLEIKIVAQAIQADGFADAAAAWTAFVAP